MISITKTLTNSIRRALLYSCLAISLLALAIPARAENPPKLSDAAATAYLQKLSDIADSLLKALQDKDEAKTKELGAKFTTILKDKDADAIMEKLPPADQKAATDWMGGQMQKLADAGYTLQ